MSKMQAERLGLTLAEARTASEWWLFGTADIFHHRDQPTVALARTVARRHSRLCRQKRGQRARLVGRRAREEVALHATSV